MEPIRILQVVTSMNMGGVENFLMNYYRHIDRTKVQFDFLKHRSDKSYFDDEIVRMGGNLFSVPAIRPSHHLKYLKALNSFLVQHPEYRIIHTHIGANGMYALRSAKKNLVPVRIAQSHSAPEKMSSLGFRAPFVQYAKQRIMSSSTHNFACGHAAGTWLFGKSEHYRMVPNAIDTHQFSFSDDVRMAIRSELGISEAFVVGHVGRFNPVKNHSMILKVFREINRAHPDSVLLLVGDGELRETIEHQAQTMNLADKIKFLGVCSNVYQFMQAMDAFLLPSFFEGFSVTLVEAQAAGLPCVVSDTVSKEVKITDLVEFVPLSKSPEEWAKIVLEKTQSTNRRDYSEEVTKAGFDVVENAKWLQEFYIKAKEQLSDS